MSERTSIGINEHNGIVNCTCGYEHWAQPGTPKDKLLQVAIDHRTTHNGTHIAVAHERKPE